MDSSNARWLYDAPSCLLLISYILGQLLVGRSHNCISGYSFYDEIDLVNWKPT
jgi:hypothetical protein